MKPLEPIYVVEHFPPLSRELLTILKALHPTDWARPTICLPWSVKDVTAHLLGGNFGRLWSRAETLTSSQDIVLDYDELVSQINRDNEIWVQAAKRISPQILIELLELTDHHLYQHFKSHTPDAPAKITVAWAGDSLPPNWFDIAREYTEKWLHQQHIREAVGKPLLTERKWLHPVLDTFMRGLPHAYRNVEAPDGTCISIRITGEAGGEWSLVRGGLHWRLLEGLDSQATSWIQLDQNLAWRLFTKGVHREEVRQQVDINGDTALGEHILEMVTIMA